MALIFNANDVILFQGDSITDAGRNKETDCLGNGWVKIAASLLQANYPKLNLTVINKGISGNRAKDLKARWQQDCLDLKPNWLTILIGINDTWRRYDRNDPTTAEDFGADLLYIVEAAQAAGIKVILCEPFLLPVRPDQVAWREDLDPKIQQVRKVAVKTNSCLLAFDGRFAEVSCQAKPEVWAADGVHASSIGAAFMAEKWLECVGAR